MKKFRFFSLMIAALGLGFGFTSCEEDLLGEDGEASTIQITANVDKSEVVVGDDITVSYDVIISQNKIESIELSANGASVGSVMDGFDTDRQHEGTFTYTTEEVGDLTLTLKVTDNKDNPKTETIDVTVIEAPGEINNYSAVLLGNQDAEAGSSFSTSTDERFTISQAKANASKVDFIHYRGATNGAAIASPDGDGVAEFNVFDTANWSTLNSTRFKSADVDFDAIADDGPIVPAAEGADLKEATNLSVGDVFAFVTEAGKKGVFEVSAVTDNDITIEVKVQK